MPQYTAFISYSHRDARFAKALQHDLEKFRTPQSVAERLGRDSHRLGTIFRDVSDLGAAARLTQALTTALANSQALIVVCSPAAEQSDWVRQEIDDSGHPGSSQSTGRPASGWLLVSKGASTKMIGPRLSNSRGAGSRVCECAVPCVHGDIDIDFHVAEDVICRCLEPQVTPHSDK